MTMMMLLDVAKSGPKLFEGKAERQLARIDVSGLRLRAGESIEFELFPAPTSSSKLLTLVGDDPPPDEGLSTSLPVRAGPRELFGVAVTSDPARPEIWRGAKFVAVYESTPWLDYLPAPFLEDPDHADFLRRLLGSLFVDGERIELQLDEIANLIVPSSLPSLAAARFLSGWFDIDLDVVLPQPKSRPPSDDDNERLLALARKFLARVLPHALTGGTAGSILNWIDAAAQARGMALERRRQIALVEGFKMRRLFTLPAEHLAGQPEPGPLRRDWGCLPHSSQLANDPLGRRAFLDSSKFMDEPTLGIPGETDDETLLARLLGCRLWLFLPPYLNGDPTPDDWRKFLAPVLPTHLSLEVVDRQTAFHLGYDTVLGMSTTLPPLPLGSVRLGDDTLLPTPSIKRSSLP